MYVLPTAFRVGSSDELLVYMVHQAVHQAVDRAAQAVYKAAQDDLRYPRYAPHIAANQADRLFRLGIGDHGAGIYECVDFARHRPYFARLNAENYARFIVNLGRHN